MCAASPTRRMTPLGMFSLGTCVKNVSAIAECILNRVAQCVWDIVGSAVTASTDDDLMRLGPHASTRV